jgi:hypothetical protein
MNATYVLKFLKSDLFVRIVPPTGFTSSKFLKKATQFPTEEAARLSRTLVGAFGAAVIQTPEPSGLDLAHADNKALERLSKQVSKIADRATWSGAGDREQALRTISLALHQIAGGYSAAAITMLQSTRRVEK